MKCIWFTGFPCSGKTTLANMLSRHYQNNKVSSCVLDGDDLREGVSSDLDYSIESRGENLRRAAHMASILMNNDIIPIVSMISPYQVHRNKAAKILNNRVYFIYLDIKIEDCMKRDTKGMFGKANNGLIKNFTGVDDDFEIPTSSDLVLNTADETADESLDRILKLVNKIR